MYPTRYDDAPRAYFGRPDHFEGHAGYYGTADGRPGPPLNQYGSSYGDDYDGYPGLGDDDPFSNLESTFMDDIRAENLAGPWVERGEDPYHGILWDINDFKRKIMPPGLKFLSFGVMYPCGRGDFEDRRKLEDQAPGSRSVYVIGLPNVMTKAQAEELFQLAVGPVRFVSTSSKRHRGTLVRFVNHKDVEKALALCGNRVRVGKYHQEDTVGRIFVLRTTLKEDSTEYKESLDIKAAKMLQLEVPPCNEQAIGEIIKNMAGSSTCIDAVRIAKSWIEGGMTPDQARFLATGANRAAEAARKISQAVGLVDHELKLAAIKHKEDTLMILEKTKLVYQLLNNMTKRNFYEYLPPMLQISIDSALKEVASRVSHMQDEVLSLEEDSSPVPTKRARVDSPPAVSALVSMRPSMASSAPMAPPRLESKVIALCTVYLMSCLSLGGFPEDAHAHVNKYVRIEYRDFINILLNHDEIFSKQPDGRFLFRVAMD